MRNFQLLLHFVIVYSFSKQSNKLRKHAFVVSLLQESPEESLNSTSLDEWPGLNGTRSFDSPGLNGTRSVEYHTMTTIAPKSTEAVTLASPSFSIPLSYSVVTGVVSEDVDLNEIPESWNIPDFSALTDIPPPLANGETLGGQLGAIDASKIELPDVAEIMATNPQFIAFDRSRGTHFGG